MKTYIYNPSNTIVHRLSPVTKIISVASFFALTMTFSHPVYLTSILLSILILTILSKSIGALWNLRYLFMVLFLFPMVLWSIYKEGTHILYNIGPITLTSEGFLYGLSMGLRLTGMLIAGLVMLSSTKVEEFTAGLNKLGIPYRVSFSLTLAFRLVPLFFETFFIISQAQQSRGLTLKSGNLFQRIKKTLPVFIPVFVSGIRRTDQLAIALESKGFGYSRHRTSINPIRFLLKDKCITTGMLLLVTIAIIFRIAGFGEL